MNEYAAQLVSCKCRSAWCENEFCRSAAIERLYEGGRTGNPVEWDYRKVRHFWLTVDRDKFDTPADAYDETKQDIGYLMQKLRRKISNRGLVVEDYLKVLEWHKDGYPHWHYLVLVNKAGKYGQLGYDTIDCVWGNGLVQERYIQDCGHWSSMMGYQCKRGYIGKAKDHQVTLPDWALERESGTIRKGSRAHRDRTSSGGEVGNGGDDSNDSQDDGENMERKQARNNRRSYKARLKDCDNGSKLLDMERSLVYELPLSASDIRDVIIPEMLKRGMIYAEAYCENKGYVILFECEGVHGRWHAMDWLYTCMIRVLEDMSGMEYEPDWGERVELAMRRAQAEVVKGVG